MEETWENITGYEKKYQISNFGNFKYLNEPRFLKEKPNGYIVTSLRKNGESKNYLIHRLVALMFIPNPDSKLQVNHKDGNRSNNHVNNLEWMLPSENVSHSYQYLRGNKNIPKYIILKKKGGVKNMPITKFSKSVSLDITNQNNLIKIEKKYGTFSKFVNVKIEEELKKIDKLKK